MFRRYMISHALCKYLTGYEVMHESLHEVQQCTSTTVILWFSYTVIFVLILVLVAENITASLM